MSSWVTDPVKMWTEEELSYWLAFDQMPSIGVGNSSLQLLFDRLGTMKAVWEADKRTLLDLRLLRAEILDLFLAAKAQIDPEKLLKTLRATNTEAYPLKHPLFPQYLRQIKDAPTVLYVRGRLSPEDLVQAVAVVGTRRPTTYGQRIAKSMGRGLAERGGTVVSGMAVGVDSLAHWGAIEGGGRTIAVAACGPDLCIPTTNRLLYKKLVDDDHGAVVSEYFPGTPATRWSFPRRNRIISGLCEGVAIIEAGESSGALITAHIAFDQGRQVFAIPGRVDNPMAIGTNKLIARLKAQLITDHDDMIGHLGSWQSVKLERPPAVIVELFGREKEVFEIITAEPIHFDVLCEELNIQAGELSATLTMLELGGLVERTPGDWYVRR